MRLLSYLLASLLLLIPPALSADLSFPSSSTIYYWAINAAAPKPLVQVSYNSASLKTSISSYTPPSLKKIKSDVVRIGFYDPTTEAWRGTVTSVSAFSKKQLVLSLHLDPESGEVYHVGVGVPGPSTASNETKKGKEEERLQVVLVKPSQGPQPKLNKPVVLNAEGKIPEKEPEKSFLQKYWWIVLGVAMLAMAGGGDK